MKKAILITGASSGIGKEIAKTLAKEGYRVFAGVRKKADKYKLEKIDKNITGVYLDVTNNASIDKAFWFILKQTESLEALVNNAGIAIGGPMEFMPIKKLKEQFEVNTFAPVAVAQRFLPMLGFGKIINISSMASSGLFPFAAPYCASKRSLDILFRALEIELTENNIKVVSIKPGVMRTPIWDKTIKHSFDFIPDKAKEKYKNELNFLERNTYNNNLTGESPKLVAKAVLKAIKAKNPKPSYKVGADAKFILALAKLPERFVNFVIKKSLKSRVKQ